MVFMHIQFLGVVIHSETYFSYQLKTRFLLNINIFYLYKYIFSIYTWFISIPNIKIKCCLIKTMLSAMHYVKDFKNTVLKKVFSSQLSSEETLMIKTRIY